MRIVRKDFATWLKKHKRMAFYPNEPCMCPIACYLTDRTGGPANVLSPDAYGPDWELTLPKWATDFVDAFDAMPGRTVSGERALTLL